MRTALSLILPVLLNLFAISASAQKEQKILDSVSNSTATVLLPDGQAAKEVEITRHWSGTNCEISLTNRSVTAVRVNEVILFTAARLFSAETKMYGEGFQMLSQTAGTVGNPVDLGHYTDRKHYRLPEPAGYRVVYDLLYLAPAEGQKYLFGFTSANRYIGKFYVSADSIRVVLDLENLTVPPGATWRLEDFFMESGSSRSALFEHFATAIQKNHPRLAIPVPTGWCSWYCFGPAVTAKNIYDNLEAIKQKVPKLKYIQLDDGYQSAMGDWLSTGSSFGGGIRQVLQKIKQQGFEPAIWVAPFICDSNSSVFREHKDWLVQDSSGHPLRSDKVGFGGWRLAPWYVLDGTNPAVQRHLESVFASMRKDWGCTYFKLDANYWGTIPGGKYYKPDATRTEAYRSGMTAVLRGAGKGAFILGCNQPNWPSLGLVHGARTSMDIDRDWETINSTGKENLYRSWQNGKLWWNDPDCLLLTGDLPGHIFMFHVALLYATGGMILSGDDVRRISGDRLPILKKLAATAGTTAVFDNDAFDYGWTTRGKERTLTILNPDTQSRDFHIPVSGPVTLYDFFTGNKAGRFEKEIYLKGFAGQNGAVYLVKEER